MASTEDTLPRHDLIQDLQKYSRFLPERSVLVVGCNKGFECELIRKNGATSVTGLDTISDVGKGNRFSGNFYTQASMMKMPFRDGGFNTVILMISLDDISDPEAVIREMIRVTAKNGVIYCQASSLWNSPFGHHKKLFFVDDPWIHLRQNTPEKMKVFYGEHCQTMVNGSKISIHIDSVFAMRSNRKSLNEYKRIVGELLFLASPISIQFHLKLEYRTLLTPTIREELAHYTEEDLLTGSLTWVFRKL